MAGPRQELLCTERCGLHLLICHPKYCYAGGSRDAGVHAGGYFSASSPSNAGCIRNARPGDLIFSRCMPGAVSRTSISATRSSEPVRSADGGRLAQQGAGTAPRSPTSIEDRELGAHRAAGSLGRGDLPASSRSIILDPPRGSRPALKQDAREGLNWLRYPVAEGRARTSRIDFEDTRSRPNQTSMIESIDWKWRLPDTFTSFAGSVKG